LWPSNDLSAPPEDSRTTSTASTPRTPFDPTGPSVGAPPSKPSPPEPKPTPNCPTIAVDAYRIRRDTIDRDGKLTVSCTGHLHHIGMGRRHAGQPIAMLIAGRDIRILDHTGQLIRQLTLDPTRDYQPQQ
jgi:hypothetical protein